MQKSASNKWQLASVSLIIGVIFWAFEPVPAYADCSSDNPADCVYVAVGSTKTVAPSPTVFSNPSPSCKTVKNHTCPAEIMVPTGSQAEWTSFIDRHESCASIADCDAYAWIVDSWGSCSASCGGGTQTPATYHCARTDITSGTTTTVNNSYCAGLAAVTSQTNSCNTQTCAAPAPTAMMDIVGFYTTLHDGRGGSTDSYSNASSDSSTLNAENNISISNTSDTAEGVRYSGIDFKIVLFSSDQQLYSSGDMFYREGGSAYQVYTPVACGYQGDIDAGYQCFATAEIYHIECTSGARSCSYGGGNVWKLQSTTTSIGYTGTQYQQFGFASCPSYPNSPYGACYH